MDFAQLQPAKRRLAGVRSYRTDWSHADILYNIMYTWLAARFWQNEAKAPETTENAAVSADFALSRVR